MSIKKHIRKILFVSAWCLVGAGILVLLVAAVKTRQHKDCSGYNIEISSPSDQLFIDQQDVEQLLTNRGSVQLKGRQLQSFDLRKMEATLKGNVWISKAELFFDNDQLLQVRVMVRQPIARIFTKNQKSFYIDHQSVRLPLSEKLPARLPVFTNFPTDANGLNSADRLLLHQIAEMSKYMLQDSFLMALVSQVDIKENREMEIIPAIGNQVIEWGSADGFENKFRRLKLFYAKVISQTGLDYYERIKVQYSNQVIGVKHADALSKYDSLQAIKNVESLILEAQTEQERQMRMDSMTVRKQGARRQTAEPLTALTFDSTTEKPTILLTVPESKNNEHTQNPTLKSRSPYEPEKKAVATKPKRSG